MSNLRIFCVSVAKELEEMQRMGMTVPESAIKNASDLAYMTEYEDMDVSECADLLIELASIK